MMITAESVYSYHATSVTVLVVLCTFVYYKFLLDLEAFLLRFSHEVVLKLAAILLYRL